MKIIYLLIVLSFSSIIYSQEKDINLMMEDGQLRTHVIKVYLSNKNLTQINSPKLFLVSIRNKIEIESKDHDCLSYCQEPFVVLPEQSWIDEIDGVKSGYTGTMLLFDLSEFNIPFYQIGSRVRPILRWENISKTDSIETHQFRSVTSREEIYIANGIGTTLWTSLIILIFFIVVYQITKTDEKGILGLVCTVDGSLSLSLLQMAVWTAAVGSTVIAFGLMKLQVPNIPISLILLMGLSTGTSAVGHWQAHRLLLKSENIASKKSKPKLRTLLSISVDEEQDPSLAKVQLLFWTFATVILFLVKSFIDGELWAVPDELVALMGVSQAGFLTRKQMAIKETENK